MDLYHDELDVTDMKTLQGSALISPPPVSPPINRLPSEIIDSIIDVFPPTREVLEPISLVSKAFTAHCQRRLLSSISLWAQHFEDPKALPGKSLLDLLEHSPHIGGYISTVSIYFTRRGDPKVAFAEQDFWVYHDLNLVPALRKLVAVRHLTLAHFSEDGTWVPETMEPRIREILAAVRADEHLTVLNSFGMPPIHLYHALTMLPNVKHLSFTPKEFLPPSDPQVALSGTPHLTNKEELLSLFSDQHVKRVELTSLAICDRMARYPKLGPEHMQRASRPLREDISFLHKLHLSKLKKLFFGCETMDSGAIQGDLSRILKQCQNSLEELRAVPSFRNGEAPLAYIESHCPRLDQFPSLRVFETCLYASEDILHLANYDYFDEMNKGAPILQAFADSFLASASPTNNIEHIRLFIWFDKFAFSSWYIQGWNTEYDPKHTQEIMGRIKDQFTPEYGRLLGLHHIDRVLTSVDGKFERLKKLTIIVGPHRPFFLCDQEALLDAYKALFADWELTRRGRLAVVFQKDHRLIEDVSDWIDPNV
ncbi:hypothetical protein BKA70DRAFT_1280009 [Coprinopsis sp. MPI-PUGE-AT-0042]|nr:hypothetical protein BKA70DRAFT_1280009 [Coprinopsis sp. MPI-PUGE-AT-0042]